MKQSSKALLISLLTVFGFILYFFVRFGVILLPLIVIWLSSLRSLGAVCKGGDVGNYVYACLCVFEPPFLLYLNYMSFLVTSNVR